MMPKEKAIELYEKFFYAIPSMTDDGQLEDYTSKKCALIAVDEILNEFPWRPDYGTSYWEEVKLEIEKL